MTHKALGSYSLRLDSSVLLDKKPDRASIASMHKKRSIYFEEPDSRKDLNGARLKEFGSGVDELNARKLYSMDGVVTLHCTLKINVNTLPDIVPWDDAMQDRLKLFEWNSTFSHNVNEINVEKNIYASKKIFSNSNLYKTYGMQWLHILANEFQNNQVDGEIKFRTSRNMENVLQNFTTIQV